MGQVCTVCRHAEREAINAALIAGGMDTAVARRWSCDPDVVRRHCINKHFPSALVDDAIKRKCEEEANGTDNVSLIRTTGN